MNICIYIYIYTYTGPEVELSERYGAMLNAVFVILMYSPGMPILYSFGVIFFASAYWADKITLLEIFKRCVCECVCLCVSVCLSQSPSLSLFFPFSLFLSVSLDLSLRPTLSSARALSLSPSLPLSSSLSLSQSQALQLPSLLLKILKSQLYSPFTQAY